MGHKSDAGKGSLIRQGFKWGEYEDTYKKIFHPRCKSCGSILEQRAGWGRAFYCSNKNCNNYNKIERKL